MEWGSGHLPWLAPLLSWLPAQRRTAPSGSSFGPGSETSMQDLQLPWRYISPWLPPTLPCPSEVPDGLVQSS